MISCYFLLVLLFFLVFASFCYLLLFLWFVVYFKNMFCYSFDVFATTVFVIIFIFAAHFLLVCCYFLQSFVIFCYFLYFSKYLLLFVIFPYLFGNFC